MNTTQRQALIDLLADVLAGWGWPDVYNAAAVLVDGPLAPVIEALAAAADDDARDDPGVSDRLSDALDALDPAWLGES